MEQKLRVAPGIAIARSELQFRFSRSGGAGGQNVNKVSSRVELLFHVNDSTAFTPEQKERLQSKLHSRMNADGFLVLTSQESRSQWHNREKVVARLVTLLSHALKRAPVRVATKATRASGERRLHSKGHVAKKKRFRRVSDDE
jgi:ribosome-associated protein